MEPRRPCLAKAILKKEMQTWRQHNSRLQAMLQSCSKQNNMVLTQKIDTQIKGTK